MTTNRCHLRWLLGVGLKTKKTNNKKEKVSMNTKLCRVVAESQKNEGDTYRFLDGIASSFDTLRILRCFREN